SLKYNINDLVSGNVHLDILSGREAVRGQTGGNDPVVVASPEGVTLSIPTGALGENTAVSVEALVPDSFLPANSNVQLLQEVRVNLAGEALNVPAQLSMPSAADPTGTYVLARVD